MWQRGVLFKGRGVGFRTLERRVRTEGRGSAGNSIHPQSNRFFVTIPKGRGVGFRTLERRVRTEGRGSAKKEGDASSSSSSSSSEDDDGTPKKKRAKTAEGKGSSS